jgi:hypothetical protein
MRPSRLLAIALVLAGLPATRAFAQESRGLASLLLNFFSPDNPVVLAPNPDPTRSHAAHFRSQTGAQGVLQGLNAGIAAQISTFPIGSSSAGFTYSFDEGLGVYNRTTQSLGPIFTERPLTAGKGKFTFGVNYQQASWDSFEGRDLDSGEMALYLTHEDTDGSGTPTSLFFEGDLIRSNLRIDLETKTTVLYANYGLSERFDLSVAVPFQDVTLSANIDATVERVATGETSPIHRFLNGTPTDTLEPQQGSANGIGDILIRGKYNFLRSSGGGLAAFVDLRLPTGDEDNLLGSGATQTKLSLVGAGNPNGRFLPRGSLGYTFSSGGSEFTGDLPNEFNYTAGFDIVVHSRVTLTADFIGRTLIDGTKLEDKTSTFRYSTQAAPTTILETTRTELTTTTGNVNLMLASAGIKINPVGHLLFVGNVLFKVGDSGLQADIIPTFGLGYTF